MRVIGLSIGGDGLTGILPAHGGIGWHFQLRAQYRPTPAQIREIAPETAYQRFRLGETVAPATIGTRHVRGMRDVEQGAKEAFIRTKKCVAANGTFDAKLLLELLQCFARPAKTEIHLPDGAVQIALGTR